MTSEHDLQRTDELRQNVLTGAALLELDDLTPMDAEGGVTVDGWGGWVLDLDLRTLKVEGYEIDLDRCLSSAAVLDWLVQVDGKHWGTPTVVAGLLRAIDDVLHVQSRMCSFAGPSCSEGTTITVAEAAQCVARFRVR